MKKRATRREKARTRVEAKARSCYRCGLVSRLLHPVARVEGGKVDELCPSCRVSLKVNRERVFEAESLKLAVQFSAAWRSWITEEEPSRRWPLPAYLGKLIELLHAATVERKPVLWCCDECGSMQGAIGPAAVHDACRAPDGPGSFEWRLREDLVVL